MSVGIQVFTFFLTIGRGSLTSVSKILVLNINPELFNNSFFFFFFLQEGHYPRCHNVKAAYT